MTDAPGPGDGTAGPAKGAISAGARAARLLRSACERAPAGANALQLEVVGELARDLGRQLDALHRLAGEGGGPDVPVEAALRCADLATLAACAAPHLPPGDARESGARAALLAADAVRTVNSSIGAGDADEGRPGGEHGALLRDVRSAAWRAGVAARQVDGPAGAGIS